MGVRSGSVVMAVLVAMGASAASAQTAESLRPEAQRIAGAVTGAWKEPTGSCDSAYFKSADLTKSIRGEDAMSIVVSNAGTTVNGTLILAGAREGQVVNPMTDRAIFLIEPLEGDKLHVIPIGEPALGWPEVNLDLCPGSRS